MDGFITDDVRMTFPTAGLRHKLTLEKIEESQYQCDDRQEAIWRWLFVTDKGESLWITSSRRLGVAYDGTPSKARSLFTPLADGRPLDEFAGPIDFVGLSLYAKVFTKTTRKGKRTLDIKEPASVSSEAVETAP